MGNPANKAKGLLKAVSRGPYRDCNVIDPHFQQLPFATEAMCVKPPLSPDIRIWTRIRMELIGIKDDGANLCNIPNGSTALRWPTRSRSNDLSLASV